MSGHLEAPQHGPMIMFPRRIKLDQRANNDFVNQPYQCFVRFSGIFSEIRL